MISVAQMRYPVTWWDQRLWIAILCEPVSPPSLIVYLIESVLSPVADVDQLDDLGLEPLVEHVGLGELSLEVGGPGQDEAGHVGLVVGQEQLDRRLRHLPHVVVPLLHPETSETQRRLSSSAVLLWQIHCELVKHISGVALNTI